MKTPSSQLSPREVLLGKQRGRKRAAPRRSQAAVQQHGDRTSGDDDDDDDGQRRFVTGPGVCARYRVSDMSIWRWLHDAELGFPRPAMIVNGRRFWLEADLRAWENARLRQGKVVSA
jgi:predicted DNA-binding transcriptional regulator AlpA